MIANKQLTKEKIYTYEDIDNLPEGLYEIIDGRIVELSPTGFEHGSLEGLIFLFLYKHLKEKGFVATGEVGILIQKKPLRLRAGDVVFVSKETYKEKPKGILEKAPELVIEIVSPSNKFDEIQEKVEDYLKIGVKKVIVVEPSIEKVYVYESGKNEIKVYKFDQRFTWYGNIKASMKEIMEQ